MRSRVTAARTFAQQLGHDDVAQMLQQTLDEEKGADEKLNEIACSTSMKRRQSEATRR